MRLQKFEQRSKNRFDVLDDGSPVRDGWATSVRGIAIRFLAVSIFSRNKGPLRERVHEAIRTPPRCEKTQAKNGYERTFTERERRRACMLRTLAVKPKLALDCALDYRVSREAMSESVKPAMVCVGKIHVSLMKKKKKTAI